MKNRPKTFKNDQKCKKKKQGKKGHRGKKIKN
jgi:hypothetical protein